MVALPRHECVTWEVPSRLKPESPALLAAVTRKIWAESWALLKVSQLRRACASKLLT